MVRSAREWKGLTLSKTNIFGFFIRNGKLLYWLALIGLAGSTILSRLLFNGYIFDFDYHLYQPDGALYTFQALHWSGIERSEAARQVIDWYLNHGEDGTRFTMESFDSALNPEPWGLVNGRFLYALLSIPFVALLGIPGMLAIPVISTLALFILIGYLAWRNQSPIIGILLLLTISSSLTVSRWYIVNYTDSLLAGLFLLLLIFIKDLDKDLVPKRYLLVLFLLVLLTSFTRFCIPYWYGIALVLFIRRRRLASVVIALSSTIGLIPILLARPNLNSVVVGQEDGLIRKILYLPISAIKILFVESAQLVAIDRSLIAILALAFILAIMNLQALSSQIFIATTLAGWAIGVINGVLGVNFRYQLPVLGFAALVIIELLTIQLIVRREEKIN